MRLNVVQNHLNKMADKIAAMDDKGVAAYVEAQCHYLIQNGEHLADYELVRTVRSTSVGQMKVVYSLEFKGEKATK